MKTMQIHTLGLLSLAIAKSISKTDVNTSGKEKPVAARPVHSPSLKSELTHTSKKEKVAPFPTESGKEALAKPKKVISRRPNGSKKNLSRKSRKMKYKTPEQLELARKRAILRLRRYLNSVRVRQFRAQMQRHLNLAKLRRIMNAEARLKKEKASLHQKLQKTSVAIKQNQRLHKSLAKQISVLGNRKSASVQAARRSLRRAAASASRRKFMSQDMGRANRRNPVFQNNGKRIAQPGAAGSVRTSAPKIHRPKPMPTKTQPLPARPPSRVHDL